MKRIEKLREAKHGVLQKELRGRQSKQNLRQAIQRGTSMTYVSSEGNRDLRATIVSVACRLLAQLLKKTVV